MSKAYYLIGLIILSSCLDKHQKNEKAADTSTIEIERTFFEVESLLKIDNGKFWNHQLYGSIILVDPKTRAFIANKNNASGDFKKVNLVYTDTLPETVNIANTAISWNEERWTMVMLPLPDDAFSRNNLLIHELFHGIQPAIGFENIPEEANAHLDMFEGRLMLKLELEALKKALYADGIDSKRIHLKNALTFRNIRQSNEERKQGENMLELNEGLAEYTAMMLSGRSGKELKLHLSQGIDVFYNNPTFVRSFAYQTIPIYGYLLSKQHKNWQLEISKETNLTDFMMKSFNIEPIVNPMIEQIAMDYKYNYQEILKIENARETKRLAQIAAYKKMFLKEPVLRLDFKNMNISFDPRNIVPLDSIGTVYPNIRVTDNWGILTVENGALLSSNWSHIIVTAPTNINNDKVEGKGWTLELNKGWVVKNLNNKFELKKVE